MATLDNNKTFYRPNLFFYLRKLWKPTNTIGWFKVWISTATMYHCVKQKVGRQTDIEKGKQYGITYLLHKATTFIALADIFGLLCDSLCFLLRCSRKDHIYHVLNESKIHLWAIACW